MRRGGSGEKTCVIQARKNINFKNDEYGLGKQFINLLRNVKVGKTGRVNNKQSLLHLQPTGWCCFSEALEVLTCRPFLHQISRHERSTAKVHSLTV